VWIYRLLFVILFVCFVLFIFIRLRISSVRIKLAASNFERWFRGVLGRESSILGNFAPPEAQNRTNRRAAASIADRRQSLHWRRARRHWRGQVSIGNTCPRHVWIYGRSRRRTCLYCIDRAVLVHPRTCTGPRSPAVALWRYLHDRQASRIHVCPRWLPKFLPYKVEQLHLCVLSAFYTDRIGYIADSVT